MDFVLEIYEITKGFSEAALSYLTYENEFVTDAG